MTAEKRSIFNPGTERIDTEDGFVEFAQKTDRIGFFKGTLITLGVIYGNQISHREFESSTNVKDFINGKKTHPEFHQQFTKEVVATLSLAKAKVN